MEEHNLNVQEELEIKEFVKRPNNYDNHLHLFPDMENRELHAFLHVGEAGSGEVVKTTVENVRFKNRYSDGRETGVKNWFLTYKEVENVISFLNCLKWERTEAQVTVEWIEEGGRPMMEGTGIGEEVLNFKYKTESGNRNSVSINSVYEQSSKSVHMMANFK